MHCAQGSWSEPTDTNTIIGGRAQEPVTFPFPTTVRMLKSEAIRMLLPSAWTFTSPISRNRRLSLARTLRKGTGRRPKENVAGFLYPRSPEWEPRDFVHGE